MLEKILSFVLNSDQKKGKDQPSEAFSSLTLNTALLMIDIAGSDHQLSPEELDLIRSFLGQEFSLSEEEVKLLLDEAHKALQNQTDLWEPLSELNRQLDTRAKRDLLQKLWKIVYTDGRLDGHEDHLMHKIADLLKLDHEDLIQTKLQAKSSAV